MAASRFIRNTTGSDIFIDDVGVDVPAGQQIEMDFRDLWLWARSVEGGDVEAGIDSGDLVINDGIRDLESVLAKDFLRVDPIRVTVNGATAEERVKSIDFVGSVISLGGTGGGVEITSGKIITHKKNSLGRDRVIFDSISKQLLNAGPDTVVARSCGDVVRSRL